MSRKKRNAENPTTPPPAGEAETPTQPVAGSQSSAPPPGLGADESTGGTSDRDVLAQSGTRPGEADAGVHDDSRSSAGHVLTGGSDGQETGPAADDHGQLAAPGAGNPDGQASVAGDVGQGGQDRQHAPDAAAHGQGDGDRWPKLIVDVATGGLVDDDERVDTNTDRALWASACSYSKGMKWSFIGRPIGRQANSAAAFLRAYPEANAEAVTIHLQRAGFLDVPKPDRRGLAAWKVFAFTLHQLDAVDAQEAAERAAAEAKPAPAGGLPLDQAFKPEPGAFDPTGFMPR